MVKIDREWRDVQTRRSNKSSIKEQRLLEVMLREAELSAQAGAHESVVSFLGVCFEYNRVHEIKPFIAFERMECNVEVPWLTECVPAD